MMHFKITIIFFMPSSPNQRMKLLHLMKILLEQTEDNQTLTIAELIAALDEHYFRDFAGN